MAILQQLWRNWPVDWEVWGASLDTAVTAPGLRGQHRCLGICRGPPLAAAGVGAQPVGASRHRNGVLLLAVAASALIMCIAMTAVGDTFDTDGNRITSLHITQDEATGELDYARLTIYDQSEADAGWGSWTCFDDQPTPDFGVLVFDSRPAGRQNQSETDTMRVRVDKYTMREFEAVRVYDRPASDSMRSYTSTVDFVPRRGFLEELAAGQRLIVQIGGLRILSLDLATAEPDVVEFKTACNQMYENLMRSPLRWASIASEYLDPFTDRGQAWLSLFHETSHDGGDQPRFFVHCGNDENGHGVNLGVHLTPLLQRSVVSNGATSTLRVRADGDTDREFVVANDVDERWTTFHLPAGRRPGREFLAQLGRWRTMTVRWSDLPSFRFDLAGGRPSIADFRAKCETMLRLPSIEKAGERSGQTN